MSQPENGVGTLRGWVGMVYAIHPDVVAQFEWDGQRLVVSFGADGADLCIRLSEQSLSAVLQFVGGMLILGPKTDDEPTTNDRPQYGGSKWNGTTYDLAPNCPLDMWQTDSGWWFRCGTGPEALTLVAGIEGIGWLVHRFGEWLGLRAARAASAVSDD